MAKKPNLAAALAKKDEPQAPEAAATAPLTGKKPTANPRAEQVMIAGYFDKTVKYAFEELRLNQTRHLGRRVTAQELMEEAINDLFRKYGMAEVAPSRDSKN